MLTNVYDLLQGTFVPSFTIGSKHTYYPQWYHLPKYNHFIFHFFNYSYSLSSGQDFITTDQLQRRLRMVEKNTDKQGETGYVLSEENEQKQKGDSDLTAGREGGGNQQVMNKMAEEGKGGENGFIII